MFDNRLLPITLRLGFTGTQYGMTATQRQRLRDALSQYRDRIDELHHGDCIGADEECHDIAVDVLGANAVWIHPPLNERKRAFCESPHVLPVAAYLERNRQIVDATIGLIAAPYRLDEELRSGTWATVRYARKMKKPLWLLAP